MRSHRYPQHAEIFVLIRSNGRIRVPCDCGRKVDHYFEKVSASQRMPRVEVNVPRSSVAGDPDSTSVDCVRVAES